VNDDYFATRVRWHRDRGLAKLHGRRIELTRKPEIPGLVFDALDYTPIEGVRLIRDPGGRERDMEAHEIKALDAWLLALHAAQGGES
jgi:hypothetical protein